MKTPGVPHLGQASVVNTYPSVKNTGHYFQQKKNDQLRLAQARAAKELYFSNQPGK
jgi:hypothetical protein